RLQVVRFHPVIQDNPKLGHLCDCRRWDAARRDIRSDAFQTIFHQSVLIWELFGPAKDLRQIDAAHADAKGFQKLFTITSGVEGVWSGADGAQSSALHSVDNPTNSHKCVQIR